MSVQRRLAVILSADVVEYSRLMAADEAGTFARLKALRKELIEPKTAEYNGRVIASADCDPATCRRHGTLGRSFGPYTATRGRPEAVALTRQSMRISRPSTIAALSLRLSFISTLPAPASTARRRAAACMWLGEMPFMTL